jgi:small subunit ribosomal protein S8
MLNNIKNGQRAKKAFILQKKTNLQKPFLNELWKEGLILGYKIIKKNNNLEYFKIFLKYLLNNKPAINYVVSLSKPGKKSYCSLTTLWKLNSNIGIIFVSTSQGVLNLVSCKKKKIGGELICLIK